MTDRSIRDDQRHYIDGAGIRNFWGRNAAGHWYIEQTREVSGGTVSRRTRYYPTEAALSDAEQAGQEWVGATPWGCP